MSPTLDDDESSKLDGKEEEANLKRYPMRGGKQPVHKEPTKKKRKGATMPPREQGRVKIREPAKRPSGRRYVAPGNSKDEDEEETLQHRAMCMAAPTPTIKASNKEAQETVDREATADEVPELGQEAPAGVATTISPKTMGSSRPPPSFSRTATATIGQGCSGWPCKFRPSIKQSDL